MSTPEQMTITWETDAQIEPVDPLPAKRPRKPRAEKPAVAAVDVPVEEQPYPLPENWRWVRLGDVVSLVGGGTPPTNKPAFWQGLIPWVTSADISVDGTLLENRKFVSQEAIRETATNKVKPDTLLIVTRVGLGKVAISDKEICFNQDIQGIESTNIFFQKFLFYYFMQESRKFLSQSRGTTIPGITKKQLADHLTPLPPLPEQARIVARLESLLSKIREARKIVDEAKKSYLNRRDLILAQAFSGKLTESWRRLNSGFLAQEKQTSQPNNSFSSPDSWSWSLIKDVLKISSGGTPSRGNPEYYEGNIPWVKTGEINWNFIFDSDEHISEEAIKNSSAKLVPIDTVLVAMYGQGFTRGRAAILKVKATTNQAVCCIHPNEHFLNKFIYYYFMEGYKRFRSLAKGGNQENFSAKMIGSFPFPIISIEEQKEIVRILDYLLGLEDQALEQIENMEGELDTLEKAILSRAFRGELGTHDSSDAPVDLDALRT